MKLTKALCALGFKSSFNVFNIINELMKAKMKNKKKQNKIWKLLVMLFCEQQCMRKSRKQYRWQNAIFDEDQFNVILWCLCFFFHWSYIISLFIPYQMETSKAYFFEMEIMSNINSDHSVNQYVQTLCLTTYCICNKYIDR